MASINYVKVDPATGKRVIVSLKDVSPYWIYDTKTVKKDSRVTSFFSDVNANDPVSTDMLQPNQLPRGWKFVMYAIRAIPDFNASSDDIATLVFNSIIEFKKEGSEIFKAPTLVFNAGAGVYSTNNTTTNGYPSTQAVLMLPLQIELQGSQPFEFSLIKDTTLNNDIEMKLQLDGIIYRNIVSA